MKTKKQGMPGEKTPEQLRKEREEAIRSGKIKGYQALPKISGYGGELMLKEEFDKLDNDQKQSFLSGKDI